MRLLLHDTFLASRRQLAAEHLPAVERAVGRLQENQAHPGLNVHPVAGTRQHGFYSARVNDDIRLIFHEQDGDLGICYVAHHDTAYRWAVRRRQVVNRWTGAIQVQLAPEEVRKIEDDVRREARPGEPQPFAGLRDEWLLGHGVPDDWLNAIRTATLDAFYTHIFSELPAEALEALMEVATGNEPPPVPERPAAGSDPARHRDTRRRIRVIDDDGELLRAFEGDWEDWRIFLHPEQQEVVDRDFGGPARVTGAAGTGKTVVALHRAARAVRNDPDAKVLLTTFSRSLTAHLKRNLALLLGEESEAASRVEITNLHRLAGDLYGEPFRLAVGVTRDEVFSEVLASAGVPAGAGRRLIAEWHAIVNTEGVNDWETYATFGRRGRVRALKRSQRRETWEQLARLSAALAEHNLVTPEELCRRAARKVRADGSPYTHIVADEVEDFGPAELQLLAALSTPHGRLFLSGDIGQRIYRGAVSFLGAGIDIRGRSVQLRVNYRTTEQIRRFADGIMPGRIFDPGTETEAERFSFSRLSGPEPEFLKCANPEAEAEAVAGWLNLYFSRGGRPADVAVLGRSRSVLTGRIEPLVSRLGLSADYLSVDRVSAGNGLTVGTMHNAKGMEFRVVVIMGAEERYLPNRSGLEHHVDDAARAAFIERERNVLYVACTRARERLLVSAGGPPSPFLSDGTFSRASQ